MRQRYLSALGADRHRLAGVIIELMARVAHATAQPATFFSRVGGQLSVYVATRVLSIPRQAPLPMATSLYPISILQLLLASETSQKAKETGQTEQLTKYPRSSVRISS